MKRITDYPELLGAPVFPCKPNKSPLTKNGFKDATRDPGLIREWWKRWPEALVGMPTGMLSGYVVLDIDCKPNRPSGFQTLDALGIALPTDTWISITPSGGWHVWFGVGEKPLYNSASKLGVALDVRGEGGYVCVPGNGSAYEWDAYWCPFEFEHPAPVPEWMYPKAEPPRDPGPPPPTSSGLSRYAEVALDRACDNIARAGSGSQEVTLNNESFSIGTLAASGAVPHGLAKRLLLHAALRMPSYDVRRPWVQSELESKIGRAFGDGLAYPRARTA